MASNMETIRNDDFIEYFLFFDQFTNEINANIKIRQELEEKKNDCLKAISPFIDNYIWHKDKFQLIIRLIDSPLLQNDDEPEMPSHLYGITHFGENIADEWFIVFLLKYLTKTFPDLIIRVRDDDGEFLLIEAANYLPDWASPKVCEDRVFLYQNKIHLVPPSLESNNTYSISKGIMHIRQSASKTQSSEEIQKAIEQRIKGLPESVQEQLHRTNMYLPVGVAALLKKKPKIISRAVLAFCNRDSLDTRLCKAMKYFPPERCTFASVTLTRCLYAMLTHQKFIPDKRTGWKLPARKDPHYNIYESGMKLASGFEILVSQLKQKISTLNGDIAEDKAWHLYLESLKKKGYFQDFLEHSQPYNILLEKAKDYYLATEHFPFHDISEEKEILDLSSCIDDIEIVEDLSSLPPPQDESWLVISSEELDAMLEEKYGRNSFVSGEQNPANLSSQLKKFLEKVSDLEGAEFPDNDDIDSPPIRPKRGVKPKKNLTQNDSNDSPNRISFDPDSFACAVNNILDLVVPEDNWDLESDDSAMSSYEDELDLNVDQLKLKDEGARSELKQYMDQMDQELSATTMANSFRKAQPKDTLEDSFSDVEHFEPVNIDMNAVKNILESYRSELGGSGPASNLLGPMGVTGPAPPPPPEDQEN